MKKSFLTVSCAFAAITHAHAQYTATSTINSASFPNSAISTNSRLIHSPAGASPTVFGTWSIIGDPNNLNSGGAIPPNASNLYGFTSHVSGDRCFFGMRNTGQQNRAEAIIAWGDDESIEWNGSNAGPDKFIFEFHNSNAATTGGAPVTQAMTMMPANSVGGANSGVYVGIGTNNPQEQLHTTKGVRHSGITTGGTIQHLIGIDANGKLWRTTGGTGGIQNSCATVNMVPKVAATNGNLSCSRIFDNGTSVGIGVTTGFGYIWPGGVSGPSFPPSAGTLALAINGVTRSLAYFATSDEKYKTNIQGISNPFDLINSLTGKTYYWNDSARITHGADSSKQYGVIAQDVAQVMPEAVIVDENGDYAVNYNAFIPLLIEGQKELYNQLNAARTANSELEEELQTTKAQLNNITKHNLTAGTETNQLFQNSPNPFERQTTIRFNIRSMQAKAAILVMDLSGKQIASYPITARGEGNVMVDGSNFQPGMYLYSLVVDGQEVDTKKMVLGN